MCKSSDRWALTAEDDRLACFTKMFPHDIFCMLYAIARTKKIDDLIIASTFVNSSVYLCPICQRFSANGSPIH